MGLQIEDAKTLVSLAVDSYKNIPTKYSIDETQSAIQNALIKANNGKKSLDIRDIRDGKCNGLFSIIEEVLAQTEYIGIKENPLFNEIVEYKNGRLGDKNEFYVEDTSDFYVSMIAEGTQALKRQRMSGGRIFSPDIHKYGIKIYEELDRILAGRVDFNQLIQNAIKSFDNFRAELILNSFLQIPQTNPLNVISVTTDTYSEDELLDLCIDVENSARSYGENIRPVIMGTKKALRNIALDPTTLAEQGKLDLYNNGYYGKFRGYTCIEIPQTLRRNTLNGYLPDNVLWIISSLSDKPVKFFTEGEPFVVMGNPLNNADLSQDWLMQERFGCGIVLSGRKNGVYTIAQS